MAALWHKKLNGALAPTQVGPAADNKVWWQCPKNRKHAWAASVYNVAKSTSTGCPFCVGQQVDSTNCLANLHPELLKEWHQSKNKSISAYDVTSGSTKAVWWQCSKCPNHVWQTAVKHRTRGAGCPYCAHQKLSDENHLTTLFPKVASEWVAKKNKNLQPQDFSYGSKEKVWWKCSLAHSWQASIKSRTSQGCSCPYCAGKLATRETCLKAVYPLVAQQWHPTRNGKLTPLDVLPKSNKTVWWKCIAGHIWEAQIFSIVAAREERLTNGCPKCAILERGKRTKYLKKRRKADSRLAKLE